MTNIPLMSLMNIEHTVRPDVVRGGDGKHHEEENEEKALEAVGRDALSAENDGAHELALRSLKAGAKHVADAAIVGRCH